MKNNSQLAFPCPNDANVNGDTGLTKREWFAGMAMQGFIASQYSHRPIYQGNFESIAKFSREMAERMIDVLGEKE